MSRGSPDILFAENVRHWRLCVPETIKHPSRPVVCIQGLGFVGTAMAIATASALNAAGIAML